MAPVISDIHSSSPSIPPWGIFGIIAAGAILLCVAGYFIFRPRNKPASEAPSVNSDIESPTSTELGRPAMPFAQPPPASPPPPIRSVTAVGIISSSDFKRLWKDMTAPSAAAVAPTTGSVSVGGAVPALASPLSAQTLCEKMSEADSTTAQPPTPAFPVFDSSEDQEGFTSSGEAIAEIDIPDAAEIVANIHLSISSNSVRTRASASSTGSGFTTENVRDISIAVYSSTSSAYSWSSTCTLETAPSYIPRNNSQYEVDLADSPPATPPPPSASPSTISMSSFSSSIRLSGSSTFHLSAIFLSPLPSDSEDETDEESDIGQSSDSHKCVEAFKEHKPLSYIMPGSCNEKETITLSTSPPSFSSPSPPLSVIAVHHPNIKLLQVVSCLSKTASATTSLLPSLPPHVWSSAIARFQSSRQRLSDTSSPREDAPTSSEVAEDEEEIQYIPRTPSPPSLTVDSEDSDETDKDTNSPHTPPRPSTSLGKISIHKPSTYSLSLSPTLSPTCSFRVGLAHVADSSSPPESPESPTTTRRRKASSAYQRPQIYTIYEEV